MDTRAWYTNKKGFFYILVLFQTVVILVTACYVVLSISNIRNGDSFRLNNSYHRYRDVKSEIKENKYERKALKAFNIVVMAKGRIVDNDESGAGRERVKLTRSNKTRSVKKYNNENNNKNSNNNNDKNRGDKNGNNNRINNNNNRNSKNSNKNNSNKSDTTNNHNNNLHQTSLTKHSSPNQRKPILMFIAIMSAPERIHRRNALRRSWLRQCEHYNTSCYMFTDALDMHGERLPEEIYVTLEQEQFLHKDLILSESPGGINFARRYLWIINWANKKYKFDFLLRVDDDYFICMDRLFLELPYRKTVKNLYWGHVHCYPPGGVRVDEGFVIVSNDLIQHFIEEQHKSLMCHPFGDQAMAMWINDIQDVTYFGDPRVNYEVTANEPILEQHADICEDFLALHGSYPIQVEQYWQRMLVTSWKRYSMSEITYPCGDQDRKYNKTNFEGMYYADPIPCKNSPVWDIGGVYVGRSGKLSF